ncbi:MAG: hypothetical protein WC972_04955 [Trueperaceae bacterium]
MSAPSKRGRPTKFKPEYVDQAAKLAALGATDREVADALGGTEEQYLAAWLRLRREDRGGVIAAQKRARAAAKKRRLEASPSARVRNATAARLWAALKGQSDGALFSRLGYSAGALVAHLEARFQPGMSWANYGRWHVDHIRPCASFDLTDPAEFEWCWSLENLQPLWAADNIAKGATYGAA